MCVGPVWQGRCSFVEWVEVMTTRASGTVLSVGVVALAIVLIATAGCCVFDNHLHRGDVASHHPCTSIIVVAIASVLFTAFGVFGNTPEPFRWAATPAFVSVLDPPP